VEETHRLFLDLVVAGVIDGLRVDHIDGLRDPGTYLARLRAASAKTWIVVEKILVGSEELVDTWPVAGTTGYDFLNRVNGLFVDSRAEAALSACYAAFIGVEVPYEDVERE